MPITCKGKKQYKGQADWHAQKTDAVYQFHLLFDTLRYFRPYTVMGYFMKELFHQFG